MIQRVRAQEHESEGQKRSAEDRLGREFETMIRLFFTLILQYVLFIINIIIIFNLIRFKYINIFMTTGLCFVVSNTVGTRKLQLTVCAS